MTMSPDVESVADSAWDVIVIGAGLAGTIAAHQLSAGGVRTLLVEKKAFPREKVCGACLNASALATLRSAGLGALIDGLGGIRLEALNLGHAGRSTQFALPGGMALSRATARCGLGRRGRCLGDGFLAGDSGRGGAGFLGHCAVSSWNELVVRSRRSPGLCWSPRD